MNTRSIQTLRRKFILVSMVAYILVILFLGACINLFNQIVTRGQIRAALGYMLQEEMEHGSGEEGREDKPADSTLEFLSPEFQYSARYFIVVYDTEGDILKFDSSRSSRLTRDEAEKMAEKVFRAGHIYGNDSFFFYKMGLDGNGNTHIVFLNCATLILTNLRILYITLLIGAAGLLIAFILVNLMSYRVIQPEIENVRRQKQFITNASHELKTPLAVIRANTEIEEMINGETEWSQSTMRQVDRLNGLVQNLVMISRAQEREDRSVMTAINVSQHVEETVKPYESLAQQEKKELVLDITPDVHMVADESKIRQLASLLIDNAFKYCDENGRIRVQLDTLRKGRTIRLLFANTYADGASVDYSRFFERFYREDAAHNVDRGGYGIGLSIAESICIQYGGSIAVDWKDGEIIFTCLLT
ncbi:MAG: GHKL domain-containing protein [Lachnospiraceae bacterium]|nr:GHKL domain-containing protein [Lachnospiraceae bacterium]